MSWTVEYGKTVKAITDPKGATIAAIKKEIELSKPFLDNLKKAKDKNPDCLVKPKVTAQSKGIAAYKGVFASLEEPGRRTRPSAPSPARTAECTSCAKRAGRIHRPQRLRDRLPFGCGRVYPGPPAGSYGAAGPDHLLLSVLHDRPRGI